MMRDVPFFNMIFRFSWCLYIMYCILWYIECQSYGYFVSVSVIVVQTILINIILTVSLRTDRLDIPSVDIYQI